jgi:uncharacterized protein (TIGR00369 family)
MYASRLLFCVGPRALQAIEEASAKHRGSFGMELLKTARADEVIEVEPTKLRFFFTVVPEMTNGFDQLHGGAYAALADVFTTAHLWGLQPEVAHVSMDFNVQYFRGIPVGTRVACETRATKVGGKVAFTHFSFIDPAEGTRFCEGSHTKAMVRKR